MKHSYILLLITGVIFACNATSGISEKNDLIIPDDLDKVSEMLDSIHKVDQGYREKLTELYEEHGFDSPEVQSLIPTIAKSDSANLAVVTAILDKHGWLGADEVGETANQTLFLVIQHGNYDVQEKYLPMMRQAVKDGNAYASELALLEDRTAIGRGELQIYGSQMGMFRETGEMYVQPLKDPETVNERRKEMGLGSIEEYVAIWDLTWDVEAYKKELPRLLEEQKKQLAFEKKMTGQK